MAVMKLEAAPIPSLFLMKRETFVEIVVVFLVVLLVYTAFSKVFDFPEFRKQMFNQPLPSGVKSVLLYAVPASELVVSAMLLIPACRCYGLVSSFVLMFGFTVYVGLIVFGQFKYVPCSCGGVIRAMGWHAHLVFNLFATTAAFLGAWFSCARIKRLKKTFT